MNKTDTAGSVPESAPASSPGSEAEVSPKLQRHQIFLALALIFVELVSGMQVYLTQTILPILAQDLNGQEFYGVITGLGMMATYMAMPIGAALLQRYRTSTLLMIFTLGVVLGAIVSSTAPALWVFLIGQVIRAFSGGALATVTIGAAALGLQGKARRLTFAFMSGSWVIAAILGPTYAASITELLSWRWAMLLYLPFLLLARWMIAANIKADTKGKSSPFPLIGSVIIGVGIALTIVPVEVIPSYWPTLATVFSPQLAGICKVILVLLGVVVLGYAAKRVLPSGTFRLSTPRHAMLVIYLWIMGTYFGGLEVVSLTAHDLLGLDAKHIGIIIMCGGLGWAVTGIFTGMRGAETQWGLRVRTYIGVFLIAVCFVSTGIFLWLSVSVLVAWSGPFAATVVMSILQTVAGIGVGLYFIDLMNFMFTDPPVKDGLDVKTMAGASVIAEGLGSVAFITLATTWAASAFGTGLGLLARHATMWVALGLCAGFTLWLVKRGITQDIAEV